MPRFDIREFLLFLARSGAKWSRSVLASALFALVAAAFVHSPAEVVSHNAFPTIVTALLGWALIYDGFNGLADDFQTP